jgi:hypothetical protein
VRKIVLCGLVLLLLATPAASADRFSGSLAAQAIYVQGPTGARSTALLAHVGGQDRSFEAAPGLALSAERVIVSHEYHRVVSSGGLQVGDELGSGKSGAVLSGAVATFESWLPEGSEVVIETEAGAPLSFGHVTGNAVAPTPLRVLDRPVNWTVGSNRNAGAQLSANYRFDVDAGWLAFTGTEFARKVEYQGDFIVHVFGADLRLNHDQGVAHYESGYRVTKPGLTGESWLNITTLRLHAAHLTLDPGANPVTAYAPNADVVGTGTVILQDAGGQLQREGGEWVSLEREDLNLVGDYELSVRGSTRGLLAAVVGDFESSLLGFNAAQVGRTSTSWGWFLAIGLGLAVVGGATGVLLVRRRDPPASTAIAAAASPLVDGVPEAPHVDPDFAWDELNEEFGVVRAGEKAGVLIVLVPEDRVQPFLQAVVARGLMAEDTGDRIHAGETSLAVLALEPSPLMMN